MTCSTCRHHSKTVRPVILATHPDLEVLEESENEFIDVYTCQHKSQPGKEVGVGPTAGDGCPLWAEGKIRSIDDGLQRLLELSEGRKEREES